MPQDAIPLPKYVRAGEANDRRSTHARVCYLDDHVEAKVAAHVYVINDTLQVLHGKAQKHKFPISGESSLRLRAPAVQ